MEKLPYEILSMMCEFLGLKDLLSFGLVSSQYYSGAKKLLRRKTQTRKNAVKTIEHYWIENRPRLRHMRKYRAFVKKIKATEGGENYGENGYLLCLRYIKESGIAKVLVDLINNDKSETKLFLEASFYMKTYGRLGNRLNPNLGIVSIPRFADIFVGFVIEGTNVNRASVHIDNTDNIAIFQKYFIPSPDSKKIVVFLDRPILCFLTQYHNLFLKINRGFVEDKEFKITFLWMFLDHDSRSEISQNIQFGNLSYGNVSVRNLTRGI